MPGITMTDVVGFICNDIRRRLSPVIEDNECQEEKEKDRDHEKNLPQEHVAPRSKLFDDGSRVGARDDDSPKSDVAENLRQE